MLNSARKAPHVRLIDAPELDYECVGVRQSLHHDLRIDVGFAAVMS